MSTIKLQHKVEDPTTVAAYVDEGERLVYKLGNRGIMKFVNTGTLGRQFVYSYWRHGVYVFKGIVGNNQYFHCALLTWTPYVEGQDYPNPLNRFRLDNRLGMREQVTNVDN